MPIPPIVPYRFNFSRAGRKVLLSNEFGGWSLASPAGFEKLVSGKLRGGPFARELSEKGFAANRMDLDGLAAGLSDKLLAGWRGPHVHIVEVTRRCNSACLYCGASAAGRRAAGLDMTPATARKTLDFVFSLETPSVMLEFQGGEPLLNFGMVRFLVEEALRRAEAAGKKVHFSIVTNLTLMDREKFDYLVSRRVTVCTSLDGPAALHDRARRKAGGSAHAAAARWLKEFAALAGRDPAAEMPNAICTVSAFSLPHARRIVDEFVRLGLLRVQLGPLERLGRARAAWNSLGCGPAEFLAFYAAALERILELNRRGVPVYEKGALMYIKQILTGRRPRYQNLDLGVRLGYAFDGSVYGSDEGRLLAAAGDGFFRLGDVRRDTFRGILKKPLARAFLLSAFPELCQPACARCVYSPWCRVMPAYNYSVQGGFWGNMASSPRCAVHKGIFDIIFAKLQDPETREIFERWSDTYA
ncbi:MAG TPA: radical SAM protein [Elusimicrobiales bacterium]|nr:radical SAM protein [Elusimicrobiales bacterium]